MGSTKNPERRIAEHNAGMVASTQHRRPLILIYSESFDTKKAAVNRERYFKGGGKAHALLKNLIGD